MGADVTFGERVRDMRIERNLSQGGLGSLMRPQRSQGWVSNVETGARGTDLEGIRTLARALDVTVAWLLGEPPAPGPEQAEAWAQLSPARRQSVYRMISAWMEELQPDEEQESRP